ncbi:PP2C family protein-serine/threonine phosphatase [bacterium]|nr:PP2C family protein-serine/threonine phosphatase [bacterium]
MPENPVPATGLRAALRNSLLGWGATGWVSPRRQRTAKLVFPVAGFAMGILVARIYRILPDEVETRELALLMAGVVVVFFIAYLVYDAVMGMELLDKRAVEADLAVARQIQQRALPGELPAPAGYELAAHHEPARQVGGDAYDAFTLPDGRVLVVVADVTGKGVSAALLMMGVLARLRALADTGLGLAELVTRVNEQMVAETETTHFSTLVVGVLTPDTGHLEYVNAGNNPPLVVRADGTWAPLQQGGLPVGMLPDLHYTAGTVTLGAGDRLLITPDGVSDADEEGGVLLDDPALAELARGDRAPDAAAVVAAIRERITARLGDERFDDVTALVLARTGTPAA